MKKGLPLKPPGSKSILAKLSDWNSAEGAASCGTIFLVTVPDRWGMLRA